MLREDLRTVRGSARRDRSGLASVIYDTSTSRSTSWCNRLLKMTSRSCPGSKVLSGSDTTVAVGWSRLCRSGVVGERL